MLVPARPKSPPFIRTSISWTHISLPHCQMIAMRSNPKACYLLQRALPTLSFKRNSTDKPTRGVALSASILPVPCANILEPNKLRQVRQSHASHGHLQ